MESEIIKARARNSSFYLTLITGVWHCSANDKYYSFLSKVIENKEEVSDEYQEYSLYAATEILGPKELGFKVTANEEDYALFIKDGKSYFTMLDFEYEIENLLPAFNQISFEFPVGRKITFTYQGELSL